MKTALRFAVTAGMAVLATSLLGLTYGMDMMIGGAIVSTLGVMIGAAFYRAANLTTRQRRERRVLPAALAAVLTPLAFALLVHYWNGPPEQDGAVIAEFVILLFSTPLLALFGALFGSGLGQRSGSKGETS